MIEIFRIAAGVATPLSLLSLIAAMVYFIHYRRIKQQETIILSIPKEDRAGIIDEHLTRYKLDAANLTRKQKYELLLKEMKYRHYIVQQRFLLSIIAFVICFGLTLYSYHQIKKNEKQGKPSLVIKKSIDNSPGSSIINQIDPRMFGDVSIHVIPSPIFKVENTVSSGPAVKD